jgi:hypothetical protein
MFRTWKVRLLSMRALEDRGNVRVPECRCRPGLTQESLSRGVALQVGGINHLQGDRATKVGIESLIGNPHRAPTQFPKATVPSPKHLVLLITLGLRHGATIIIEKQLATITNRWLDQECPECRFAGKRAR